MAEFKVGGKVACIETVTLESNKGESFTYTKNLCYTIGAIAGCKCDKISLWLGDKLVRFKNNPKSVCAVCKDQLGKEKVFVSAQFFLPLDDFKEVTFSKINEEVPVSAQ